MLKWSTDSPAEGERMAVSGPCCLRSMSSITSPHCALRTDLSYGELRKAAGAVAAQVGGAQRVASGGVDPRGQFRYRGALAAGATVVP